MEMDTRKLIVATAPAQIKFYLKVIKIQYIAHAINNESFSTLLIFIRKIEYSSHLVHCLKIFCPLALTFIKLYIVGSHSENCIPKHIQIGDFNSISLPN